MHRLLGGNIESGVDVKCFNDCESRGCLGQVL